MSFNKVTVFAPGTIGNVGPGFDVLGLAVDGLGDSCTLTIGNNARILIAGRDADKVPINPQENCVYIAASKVFRELGHPDLCDKLEISVTRALPLSGGLGASAAASVSGALGALALLGYENRSDLLIEASLHAEAAVAGRHLDNIAPCIYGGLTLVHETHAQGIIPIKITFPWWVVVATPNMQLPTKVSRGVLPSSVDRSLMVHQIAKTSALVWGLSQGNPVLVKAALQDQFAEVYRSPLIPCFKAVKNKAMDCGALGVSISGAGPSIFAICSSEDIAIRVSSGINALILPDGGTIHRSRIAEKGAFISSKI